MQPVDTGPIHLFHSPLILKQEYVTSHRSTIQARFLYDLRFIVGLSHQGPDT